MVNKFLFVLLIFCLTELACEEDDNEVLYDIQIRGTVTKAGIYPLPDAKIVLSYSYGLRTTIVSTTISDDSGKYYIKGRMPCEDITIYADKEGYFALQYPSPIMDLHYSGTREPPQCINRIQTLDFPLKKM